MENVMSRVSVPSYSLGEELINAITHGIGALLSTAALILMVRRAHDTLSLACAWMFGMSMILLYAVSCIYHTLPPASMAKRVLRVIDHCNVYLLVFGTYVPAALLGVGGPLGWTLFGIVALFTVLGIVFSAIDVDKYSKIQVVCHLVSGWSFLAGLPTMAASAGFACAALVVAGGVAYTIGSVLYGLGKNHPYMHSVFHIFCLVGTFLHFWAIYAYLL